MPYLWIDPNDSERRLVPLNGTEQRLVEHVLLGEEYRGGWQFEFTTTPDVWRIAFAQESKERAAAGLSTLTTQHAYWTKQLKAEESWLRQGASAADAEETEREIARIRERIAERAPKPTQQKAPSRIPRDDGDGSAAAPAVPSLTQLREQSDYWERRRGEEEATLEAARSDTERVEAEQELRRIRERIAERMNAGRDMRNLVQGGEIGFVWARKAEEMERKRGFHLAQRTLAEARHSDWQKIDNNDFIRGDVIRALYLGLIRGDGGDQVVVPGSGVRAAGVRISGEIDLSNLVGVAGAALPVLDLQDCWLEGQLRLAQAKLQQLNLQGSILSGIEAEGSHINGAVRLGGSRLFGSNVAEVNFSHAVIEGRLHASSIRLHPWTASLKLDLEQAVLNGGIRIRNAPVTAGSRDMPAGQLIELKGTSSRVRLDADFFRSRFSEIDFHLGQFQSQLLLQRCVCERDCALSFARIDGYFDAEGAQFHSLNASGAVIGASFFLQSYPDEASRSRVRTALALQNAYVKGDVVLHGTLIGEGGTDNVPHGIWAQLLRVDGEFSAGLAPQNPQIRFECNGSISLRDAVIGGNVTFMGAKLARRPGHDSLDGHGMRVGGSLFLVRGYAVQRPDKVVAHAFESGGSVSIMRAQIRGAVSLIGARVAASNADGVCLDFSSGAIGGGVFLRAEDGEDVGDDGHQRAIPTHGFLASGCVRFYGTEIIGGFDASGARFEAPGKGRFGHIALDLQEAQIKGTVRLNRSLRAQRKPPFACDGLVMLRNGRILGDLDLRDADICQDKETDAVHTALTPVTAAIDAEGLHLEGNLLLGESSTVIDGEKAVGSTFQGQLRFDRARIDGNVVLTGGSFSHCARKTKDHHPRVMDAVAVSLRNAEIKGDLEAQDHLRDGNPKRSIQRDGIFDLTGAEIRCLRDDGGRGWGGRPKVCEDDAVEGAQLKLESCRYERLDGSPNGALDWGALRAAWLEQQFPVNDRRKFIRGDYYPSSYQHLTKIFNATGQPSEARHIMFEEYASRIRHGTDNWFVRSVLRFYYYFLGAAIRPVRPAVCAAVVFAFSALVVMGLMAGGLVSRNADEAAGLRAVYADNNCEGILDAATYSAAAVLAVVQPLVDIYARKESQAALLSSKCRIRTASELRKAISLEAPNARESSFWPVLAEYGMRTGWTTFVLLELTFIAAVAVGVRNLFRRSQD